MISWKLEASQIGMNPTPLFLREWSLGRTRRGDFTPFLLACLNQLLHFRFIFLNLTRSLHWRAEVIFVEGVKIGPFLPDFPPDKLTQAVGSDFFVEAVKIELNPPRFPP